MDENKHEPHHENLHDGATQFESETDRARDERARTDREKSSSASLLWLIAHSIANQLTKLLVSLFNWLDLNGSVRQRDRCGGRGVWWVNHDALVRYHA